MLAELWEAGTSGVCEEENEEGVAFIAGFGEDADQLALLTRFERFHPHWHQDAVDWDAELRRIWRPRKIGERLFITPVWNQDETPLGRLRVIHNPGRASGTGEHPCTQLALESMEKHLETGNLVADIGTGSGILSVAAVKLGARSSVAVDIDLAALEVARENHELNDIPPLLVCASGDALARESFDVVVVNISATVLLALADDLLQLVRPDGWLILTGFPNGEAAKVQRVFGPAEITALNEWRCLSLRAC